VILGGSSGSKVPNEKVVEVESLTFEGC
jgi:hypothetical protein